MSPRPDAFGVVTTLVEERFADASAVMLAGSVIAGHGTPTSDLDVVVIVASPEVPWRESHLFRDWPIEVFVHSTDTLRVFFQKDIRERRPSMLRMWSEGVLARDEGGIGSALKAEATSLFDAGYPALTSEELRKLRYEVTDLLEDLEGDPDGPESTFVAPTLATALCRLRLQSCGCWLGTGKWMLREAQRRDSQWAEDLVGALRLHGRGDAQPLLRLAESTLAELGGRLFDGYSERWDPGTRE